MKVKSESEVTQSCPTLRDPMNCSLPGSSVPGIFQARVLEWVAIAFSAIDLNLSKLWEIVKDREACCTAVHGVTELDMNLSKLGVIFEGQGSLVSCSPWGDKESNVT